MGARGWPCEDGVRAVLEVQRRGAPETGLTWAVGVKAGSRFTGVSDAVFKRAYNIGSPADAVRLVNEAPVCPNSENCQIAQNEFPQNLAGTVYFTHRAFPITHSAGVAPAGEC